MREGKKDSVNNICTINVIEDCIFVHFTEEFNAALRKNSKHIFVKVLYTTNIVVIIAYLISE